MKLSALSLLNILSCSKLTEGKKNLSFWEADTEHEPAKRKGQESTVT